MSRWVHIADHISMDVYGPLLARMGLRLSEDLTLALRMACRQAINSNLDEANTKRILSEVVGLDGPDLVFWVEDTYAYPHLTLGSLSAVHWNTYQRLISSTLPLKKPERWLERLTHLGLTHRAAQIVPSYSTCTDLSDVAVTVTELRNAPLSSWDQSIYRSRNYRNEICDQDSPEWFDPFLVSLQTTEMFRFQWFWKTLIQQLDVIELDRLFQVALAHWSSPEHVSLWRPDQLRLRVSHRWLPDPKRWR